MSLEDFDDVPEAKSRASTSAVDSPRAAASRATPVPVMPPPTTSTSNCSSAMRVSAASRSNGVRGTMLTSTALFHLCVRRAEPVDGERTERPVLPERDAEGEDQVHGSEADAL